MTDRRHYDLIVSLGANCSAAHNLRYRNMRPFSLPLDWVYIENDKPIKWLINAFETKFSDFFKYENLKQLPSTNEHAVIYKDTISGFVFPNHFMKEMKSKSDYDVVAKKMGRRVKRLFNELDSAKSVLFIIAANQELNTDNILKLQKQLIKLYPDKNIDFEVMLFSAKKDTEKALAGMHIRTFKRSQNDYDFTKTNYEWAFLDGIEADNHSNKNKITIISFKLFHRKYKMEVSWKRN